MPLMCIPADYSSGGLLSHGECSARVTEEPSGGRVEVEVGARADLSTSISLRNRLTETSLVAEN
jgi:hypothetical protein